MVSNFQSPGDIAFRIFDFPVYFYGIILAIAVFVGFIVSYFLYIKFYEKENSEFILDYSPWIILCGILGARLYYCILNLPYYIQNPIDILNIRQGGLSIHGMILAGLAVLYFFTRHKKLSFLKYTDVFLCATSLAQCIGRWGNFFNSEAFGYPCNLPWKLYIPIQNRPGMLINFEYFHPTFLYESLLNLLVFITLFILFKRFSKYPGIISCCYLILYSIVRIFVEHFRIDSALSVFGVPIAQIVSCLLCVVGIAGIFIIRRSIKEL